MLVISSIPQYRKVMPQPDVHYTLSLVNHQTGQQLKLELIDLPFPARSYRVRVNGEWAKKVPVASKTAVMRQLRTWWVAH
jgi:hypothetical protein